MTDQTRALEAPKPNKRQTVWTRRLVLFLRIMATVSMFKGIYHWSLVLGIADGDGSTFEQASTPWQAATVFFAVIDLVAAVGLWRHASVRAADAVTFSPASSRSPVSPRPAARSSPAFVPDVSSTPSR